MEKQKGFLGTGMMFWRLVTAQSLTKTFYIGFSCNLSVFGLYYLGGALFLFWSERRFKDYWLFVKLEALGLVLLSHPILLIDIILSKVNSNYRVDSWSQASKLFSTTSLAKCLEALQEENKSVPSDIIGTGLSTILMPALQN